ncbi:dihydropteroate synthase [Desulfovibrio inopinatus]|uniref:dihydropteroate synthase n=1 Tax=Desulfovibrio inopinatus TaxID=102109 RepID=UPI00047F70A8
MNTNSNIPTVSWEIRGGRVLGPAPFLIAGIVNVTPDSFFDGGRLHDAKTALAYSITLLKQGADILDIGGESTRPGSDPVSMIEERRRVTPVVEGLYRLERPEGPVAISVDTYRASTAAAALDAGASIINDVSACRFDPALIDVIAQENPGYVLMHSSGRPKEMQINPQYDNVVDDVIAFFEERLGVLTRAGVREERIVLDPGIGFGKTLEHNLMLLGNVDRLMSLGRPVFMGLSNKSLFQHLLGLATADRGAATLAATVTLFMRGVGIHRVHDVAAARQGLVTAHAITAASEA